VLLVYDVKLEEGREQLPAEWLHFLLCKPMGQVEASRFWTSPSWSPLYDSHPNPLHFLPQSPLFHQSIVTLDGISSCVLMLWWSHDNWQIMHFWNIEYITHWEARTGSRHHCHPWSLSNHFSWWFLPLSRKIQTSLCSSRISMFSPMLSCYNHS
jgi:hypothetical protein